MKKVQEWSGRWFAVSLGLLVLCASAFSLPVESHHGSARGSAAEATFALKARLQSEDADSAALFSQITIRAVGDSEKGPSLPDILNPDKGSLHHILNSSPSSSTTQSASSEEREKKPLLPSFHHILDPVSSSTLSTPGVWAHMNTVDGRGPTAGSASTSTPPSVASRMKGGTNARFMNPLTLEDYEEPQRPHHRDQAREHRRHRGNYGMTGRGGPSQNPSGPVTAETVRGPGSVFCYFCDKPFVFSWDRKRHMEQDHPGQEKDFTCAYCRNPHSNESSWRRHLEGCRTKWTARGRRTTT